MSGLGHYQPQYDLYIRRRDHAMCLVERPNLARLLVKSAWKARDGGVFVSPHVATGVYLMSDEVHVVDEFPKMKNEKRE